MQVLVGDRQSLAVRTGARSLTPVQTSGTRRGTKCSKGPTAASFWRAIQSTPAWLPFQGQGLGLAPWALGWAGG